MKRIFYPFVSLFFLLLNSWGTLNAQIPGVNLNTPEAFESYTLFEGKDSTFLINNCGQVINAWDLVATPSYHTKLLPNGHLLYLLDGTADIIELDWEGNTVEFETVPGDNLRLVYEVIKMPNGNYLCAGRRSFPYTYFESKGWNMSWGLPYTADVVLEFNPTLDSIVWEWNIFDHVIQEVVDSVDTYGIVKDHPELANMEAISTFDWMESETFMINGIDYNSTLDQIALSVRKLGEIMVIDHSTTTEEARGSTGGNAGKGGDILYRWGNPGNYDRATMDQQQELYLSHAGAWLTEGEHKGKLVVYNNNFGRPWDSNIDPYSSVFIIDPPMDANGQYLIASDAPFGPVTPDVAIDRPTTNTDFVSDYGSGATILPNGNMYITNGIKGNLIECDLSGKVVWEYNIPFAFFIFRSEKYPLDYPAFADKDLTPRAQVPGAENNYVCGWLNSTDDHAIPPKQFSVLNNLPERKVSIANLHGGSTNYVLYSQDGKRLLTGQNSESTFELPLNDFVSGIYFISLQNWKSKRWETHKIVLAP